MRQHMQPLPLFTASISAIIQLDRENGLPLYQQICERLREAILSGQLSDGTRLPTERALAAELKVNRTTVMNAYNQLASEGLVEGQVGRGTLVRRSRFSHLDDTFDSDVPSWLFGLPTGEREAMGPDSGLLSELAAMGSVSGHNESISLAAGSPSISMLPAELLATIFREDFLAARHIALGYSPVEGLLSLRQSIAARMRKRGVMVDNAAYHDIVRFDARDRFCWASIAQTWRRGSG